MVALPSTHLAAGPNETYLTAAITALSVMRLVPDPPGRVIGGSVTLEGTGLFARMLQHETGHLDGFLYVDMLIGRNARAAMKTIKRNGWGVPGLSWMPGEVPDPFGH